VNLGAAEPLDRILSLRAHPDDKVRLAGAAALKAVGRKTRYVEFVYSLAPHLQLKLVSLAEENPSRVELLFDPDAATRARAFRGYVFRHEKGYPDEPVVVLGLQDSCREVQQDALQMAAKAAEATPAVVEALLLILQDADPDEWFMLPVRWGRRTVLRDAIDCLLAFGSPHGAPGLLKLLDVPSHDRNRHGILCKLLIASREKRAVLNLIRAPRDMRAIPFHRGQTILGSTCPADQLLRVLVRLTEQEERTYRFVVAGECDELVGFEGIDDREAAWRRFDAWWKENKNKPPYAEATPLPVGQGVDR